MKKGRLLLICFFLIISAFLSLILFSNSLLQFLASELVVKQELKKSDSVVVLGGSSPSRVLEAIDIYNDGLASNIILTLGGKPEGSDFLDTKNIKFPEEADLNKFVIDKLGINQENVLLIPGRVYGTLEEAIAIKKFALDNNIKSLIVTTSKTHSRRSELIFNNVFNDSGIEITINPTKYDSFDPNNLKKNNNHWKNVVLEYQKILYYYAGGIF